MNRWTKVILGACLVAALLTGAPGLFWAIPGRAETERNVTATAIQAAAQLYAQGDYALGAQAYGQLIDQGYGNVELYYNRGLATARLGLKEEAADNFREVVEKNPNNAQAFAQLGEAYFALGDNYRAAEALNKALELDPEDSKSKAVLDLILGE